MAALEMASQEPNVVTPNPALEILSKVAEEAGMEQRDDTDPVSAPTPALAGDVTDAFDVTYDPRAEVPDFIQEAMGRVAATASEWEPVIAEAEDESQRAKAVLERHVSGMIAGIMDEGGPGHALDLGLKETVTNKKGEEVERFLYLRVIRNTSYKDVKPTLIESAVTSLTRADLVEALLQLRRKGTTAGGFAARTAAPRTRILLTKAADGSVQSVVGSRAISQVSEGGAGGAGGGTGSDSPDLESEPAPIALRRIYSVALHNKIRELAYNGTSDSLRMMTSRPAGQTPVVPEDVDDWIRRYETLLELRTVAATASKRLRDLKAELDDSIQGDAPLLAPFLLQTNPKSGSRCLDIEDMTRGVSASRYLKAKRPTKPKTTSPDKKFTIKQAELSIQTTVEELVPVLPVVNLDEFSMETLPVSAILTKLLEVRSKRVTQPAPTPKSSSEVAAPLRISLQKPRKVRL